MGIDPNNLPEGFLKCMSADERKKHKELRTFAEAQADQAVREERDMHEQFEAWLRVSEIYFIHSRMDRKSTIREGQPDFCVTHRGFAVHIEFKYGNNQPSDDQYKCIVEIARGQTPVHVCYSVKDAIEKTRAAVLDKPNGEAEKRSSP